MERLEGNMKEGKKKAEQVIPIRVPGQKTGEAYLAVYPSPGKGEKKPGEGRKGQRPRPRSVKPHPRAAWRPSVSGLGNPDPSRASSRLRLRPIDYPMQACAPPLCPPSEAPTGPSEESTRLHWPGLGLALRCKPPKVLGTLIFCV